MNEPENIEYLSVINEIKSGVRLAQRRALLSVNRELILLYWKVGRIILEKASWGSRFIDRLSEDIKTEFPEIKGFSVRNLKYMRKFAEAFSDEVIVQTLSAQLSWSHTILLLDKVKDQNEREWYLKKTIENGWSVRVLEHQTATDLFSRQKDSLDVSNFDKVLESKAISASSLFKDPYVFDFISFSEDIKEKDLEDSLVSHVMKTLLEFGKGFAFVGRQFHLEVGGEDFYIDLLFYHLKLHCYVVVDLKTGKFTPEQAGKMNFYLSAVDDLIKMPEDAPSIGLILCRDKKNIVAEYALRDLKKPIGVSEYLFSAELPAELKRVLPNTDEFGERVLREIELKYFRKD
ncbi:MAG: PDDEXK nuclease domain-containing protein [Methanocorpusculum sp.]|nr:PDDEXK nuclease domain-containing protein [Methanocorpusculum sp.]